MIIHKGKQREAEHGRVCAFKQNSAQDKIKIEAEIKVLKIEDLKIGHGIAIGGS